ncbi:MAG: LPS export ABC transporter periplasmic protein LptC [Bacteroidales bacterium]
MMKLFNTRLYKIFFTKSIAILLWITMLFSCQTDLETISLITQVDESPVESAFDVRIVYSEYANVKMIMEAPIMDKYIGDDEYIEMPEGINVTFFDSLGIQTSSLKANYAISYETEKIMEAQNDVVVINERNEKLNTEYLVWDREKAIIFTDKFVKITTDEEVLFGDGFESDEKFDKWEIKKPRGVFNVETGD